VSTRLPSDVYLVRASDVYLVHAEGHTMLMEDLGFVSVCYLQKACRGMTWRDVA